MKKNLFKKCLFIIVFAIFIMCVISIMIKYDVEGEKELPFSIEKIFIVSTVDGKSVDDPNNMWNISVTQVNDTYVYLNKTVEDDDRTIKEIKLQNFIITGAPKKGNLKVLRPTGDLPNLYTYSEQNYLNDSLTYIGAQIDDMKSLEISNTGGVLGFRLALENLGTFISNEEQEITYDGRLLSNLGVKLEEIQFSISFDIIIVTDENISYKGTIDLELPANTVIEKGSSSIEIDNLDNVVFKRI